MLELQVQVSRYRVDIKLTVHHLPNKQPIEQTELFVIISKQQKFNF